MHDVDLNRLKHKKPPAIADLVLLYETYQLLKSKTRELQADVERTGPTEPVTLTEVARALGKNERDVYKKLTNLARKLSIPKIFSSRKGKGTEITPQTDALFSQIGRFLEEYQHLLEFRWQDDQPIVIRIATCHELNVRVLPSILRAFFLEHSGGPGQSGPNVEVSIVQKEWYELLEFADRETDLDLVLTICPPENVPNLALARLVLQPCFLHHAEHPRLAGQQLLEQNVFAWNALNDEVVAEFTDSRSLPRFPRHHAPKKRKTMFVRNLLEAHAHVLAKNTVAFSYRDILSESEENHLSVVDLSGVAGVEATELVAFCSPVSRKTRSAQDKDEQVRTRLRQVTKAYLEQCQRRRSDAEYLSRLISQYMFGYHTTRLPGEHGQHAHVWIRAAFSLEVTPTGFLKGRHFMRTPEDGLDRYHIFGRLQTQSRQLTHHVLWRETEPGPQYGAVNFVFSTRDLEAGKPLVGFWLGVSSWMEDYHALSGAIIMHRHNQVPPAELNRLVERYTKKDELALPWVKKTNTIVGRVITKDELIG